MRNSIVLLSFFIVASSFISINSTGPDYRDSYTGVYSCVGQSTVHSLNSGPNTQKRSAQIIVTKHATDSMVQVKLPGGLFVFKLQNKQLLPVGSHHGKGRFFGDDSLLVNMPYGHASLSTYVGKRNN